MDLSFFFEPCSRGIKLWVLEVDRPEARYGRRLHRQNPGADEDETVPSFPGTVLDLHEGALEDPHKERGNNDHGCWNICCNFILHFCVSKSLQLTRLQSKPSTDLALEKNNSKGFSQLKFKGKICFWKVEEMPITSREKMGDILINCQEPIIYGKLQ